MNQPSQHPGPKMQQVTSVYMAESRREAEAHIKRLVEKRHPFACVPLGEEGFQINVYGEKR